MDNIFKLVSPFNPSGDQVRAIQKISDAFLKKNRKLITLMGVTGSGKTFTMANVIQKVKMPTLILSHNKTLCAQLYRELKGFFPENAVEYFVSYYDYYQPEAYVPSSDLYIEKDASINDEIERLRLRATASLLEREDVIIVSSVSCIYGLGSPDDYARMLVQLEIGDSLEREYLLKALVDIQYERNNVSFERGQFRVIGDRVDIYPAYLQEAYRIGFFGDEVEYIHKINPITGEILSKVKKAYIYPAKHFVTTFPAINRALDSINEELGLQIKKFQDESKLVEAQRIRTRTNFDMEMLREMGYCNGIENYSLHLSSRKRGEPPYTLLDYFPDNFLIIIDESHVSIPQINGMYEGDRSRKNTLVNFGFRLPSALDNRPLKFNEFESKIHRAIFVSATPSDYEMKHCEEVIEQIIRPTGLLDPIIEIRPTKGQMDDLVFEIQKRRSQNERILVTTLTKKFAENLTDYLLDANIRARYLHSEIETIERVEIIRDLRKGEFDCLIGINLLREGLDLPEVSLVAILDADKEGFLRSARSLIQTSGRAARNVNGSVIFYADKVTKSMQHAMDETDRRREIQMDHNKKHNIEPKSIKKQVVNILERELGKDPESRSLEELIKIRAKFKDPLTKNKKQYIDKLHKVMLTAADSYEFEKAAIFRDEIYNLEKKKD